ncbi:NAD(P)H-binding protein [Microbacterium sp. SA39]|uniref:NAD(P)H-binding protein n=1 Tax=Microbacterium sp. SA39 TaxID=1263625 RepID=UPI00061EBB6D|nr:NAD(P)H-binding protein [Microbacterium sp. SA39]KJQ52672.1 putative sugar epimerase YhfK [Microbacterium sp. SA39]
MTRLSTLILGATGAVGGLLADMLVERGDEVTGLVRGPEQQQGLTDRGIRSIFGDLSVMTIDGLVDAFTEQDVIVYSAGSNGGARDVTTAIDGEGVRRASEAARIAGVRRFVLVSVMPESWRERDLEDDVEYYFAVKKRAEVALTRTDLDWVILRPSLLTDEPGRGRISLGPAQIHDSITRHDVAATLAEIVHQPGIRRRILEVDAGRTPIAEAVLGHVSD